MNLREIGQGQCISLVNCRSHRFLIPEGADLVGVKNGYIRFFKEIGKEKIIDGKIKNHRKFFRIPQNAKAFLFEKTSFTQERGWDNDSPKFLS